MTATRPSRLPQLEMECMKVLWRNPEATVAQVRQALERPLAYTTVMTVLDRMAAKGVVTRRKTGRAYLYTALLDREAARGEAVERLLANLFENDRAALVEYLSRRRPAARAGAARKPRARASAETQTAFAPSHIDDSLL